MGQKKLVRFKEIKTFSNVLEYPKNIAGKWKDHFNNSNAIVLELACGKGEYATGLARLYPEKNFIGIDVKGNRIWVGAKFCINNELNNVAFLRTQIQKIDTYFTAREVQEIWITFPDPQIRLSKAKKRLTHPRYIRLYKNILKDNGKIHLKTDSPNLYNFTKAVIGLYKLTLLSDIDDVYSEKSSPELNIKTYYEGLDIAKSKKIFYLCFSLPKEIIDTDSELDKILKEKIKSEDENFTEGIHFYYNENNFLVFSEKYHLERGNCCGNGCKHCPYNYENVSEPLKSKLISEKNYNGSKK